MHSQLALTEHVSLNLAPLILLDPVHDESEFHRVLNVFFAWPGQFYVDLGRFLLVWVIS